MQYTIKNESLKITADTKGAELVSVAFRGKERLWQNETGEWGGHSPVLFPVCGHFGLTTGGKAYPMKAHGFARKAKFTMTKQTGDGITFTLKADAQTLACYPYDFIFNVTYKLDGNKLIASYEVVNPAEAPLYFACGAHDSFATESADMSEYRIDFEKEERLVHQFHDDDGYLTGETHDYGAGKSFVLPQEFMQGGNTLIFKNVNSRKVEFCKKDGTKLAALTFEGFSNLLLWREGNAKFLCIEPWTNLPDLAGAQDSEFSGKDGVIGVEGKQTKTFTRIVEYF